MNLKSLQIQNFRNIGKVDEQFNPNFNVIVGGNAQGKTNLLEAIFTLTSVRSFRIGKIADLVKKDTPVGQTPTCLVQGKVEVGGVDKTLKLAIAGATKALELNGKEVRRAEAIMKQFKTVVFTPDDLYIIKGGPELRRRYIDMFAFNIRPSHWTSVKRYQVALNHRNRVIKNGFGDSLEIEPWDSQLIDLGVQVIQGRAQAIDELEGTVEGVFQKLVGQKDYKISTRYSSSIPGFKEEEIRKNPEILKDIFRDGLSKVRGEELRRGATLIGPHRDDIKIDIGERGAREFGSQGQQRILTLALKFGEVEAISRNWGEQPVLLLDDISSELDREKNQMLLSLVSEFRPQVFLTTTDEKLELLGSQARHAKFRMVEGALERLL